MKNQFDVTPMARSVTRRGALKRLGLGLTGLALARVVPQRAEAISLGQLDGDAHPNVGGVVWLKSPVPPTPAPLACGSGTLIHPRVFLTAGHGTYLVESLITQGSMALADLLVSFDSNSLDASTWRAVSGVLTHPGYSPIPDDDGNAPIADVGVLILRDPVVAVSMFPLPQAGFLDDLQTSGQLREGNDRNLFTVVGYGVQEADNPAHPPFHRMVCGESRKPRSRICTSAGCSWTKTWLMISAEPVAATLLGRSSGSIQPRDSRRWWPSIRAGTRRSPLSTGSTSRRHSTF